MAYIESARPGSTYTRGYVPAFLILQGLGAVGGSAITRVLGFALLPVLAMGIGSAVALVRMPPPSVRSGIQHFAAGVIFAVVAVELLPAMRAIHDDVVEVVAGFAAGLVLMLMVERLTGSHEHARPGVAPGSMRMLIPIGLDLFLDGVLLSIAFGAGPSEGRLLALALACELLSLGVALTVELRKLKRSRRASLLTPVLLALTTLVAGATLGALIFTGLPEQWLAALLAFGTAALLFLVVEGLLVEAHEVGETQVGTAMFFAGFLILLVLGLQG